MKSTQIVLILCKLLNFIVGRGFKRTFDIPSPDLLPSVILIPRSTKYKFIKLVLYKVAKSLCDIIIS